MTSNWKLFRVWLLIGLQSFGGGTITMTLIRRNAIDDHGWVTEEEFNRHWSLCQMTPGINLIALTVSIGRQIGGARAAPICLLGLLLPSTLLTCAFTAAFVAVRDLQVVKGAMKGVLPATVGLGMVTACGMANQPLRDSLAKNWRQLAFALFILIGSSTLLWTGKASVTSVLIGAAFLGALENWITDRIRQRREMER